MVVVRGQERMIWIWIWIWIYGYDFFLSLSFAEDVLSFPTRHHSSRTVWVVYGIWYDKFKIPFDVRSYLHTRSKKKNMMHDVSLSPPRLIRYLPIGIGWMVGWGDKAQSSKSSLSGLPRAVSRDDTFSFPLFKRRNTSI